MLLKGDVFMFKPKGRFPRKPLPFRHVFVLSIIFFTLFTVWGLWLIDRGIKPTLMQIAKTKAEQIAAYAINYGIGKKDIADMQKLEKGNLRADTNGEKLIVPLKDKDGNIKSYIYNNAEVNRLLNETTNRIQYYLRAIEDGSLPLGYIPKDVQVQMKENQPNGVVFYIPLGQATNNALLANLGPRVPVKFEVISNVKTNIEDKVVKAGINNIFLQLYIHATVEVRVVIPFAVDKKSVSTNIMIAQQFFPGDVPYYYNSGGDGLTPALPIPNPNSNSKNSQNNTNTSTSTSSSSGINSSSSSNSPQSNGSSSNK